MLFTALMLTSALVGLCVIGRYQLLILDAGAALPGLQLRARRFLDSNCLPGTFQAGTAVCEPCPAGFYQEDAGQAFCLECNPIDFSGSGSNAAISSNNNNNNYALPLCALLKPTFAPTSAPITATPSFPAPFFLPVSTPSASPTDSIPSVAPTTTTIPTTQASSLTPSKFQIDAPTTADSSSPRVFSNAPSSPSPSSAPTPSSSSNPTLSPSATPTQSSPSAPTPSPSSTATPSPSSTPTLPSFAPSASEPAFPPTSISSLAPSEFPTMVPSLFETEIDDNSNSTRVEIDEQQVCTDNNATIILHGDCVDCPSGSFYSFVLVYAVLAVVLSILFLFTPAYLWTCLDYLQTMGLLSLISNVEWPFLVRNVLRYLHYLAAFDWLGIFPCIVSPDNVQAGRFILVALPFLVVAIPPDICHLFSYVGNSCIKNYDKAQDWIDEFTAQWGILILILTLQSMAVTVGEAVLCQGIGTDDDSRLFCAGGSWSNKILSAITLCFGIAHVFGLILGLWRRRDASWSIVQRAFAGHWWWPYEFVIRKLAMVFVTFKWEGTVALILVVAIDVASIVWYLIVSPYGDDNRPDNKCRQIVSSVLLICLVLLPGIHVLHAADSNQFSSFQRYLALVCGGLVVAVAFTSIVLGQLWLLLCKRPVKVDAVKEEERDQDDEEDGNKSEELNSFDEQLLIEVLAEEVEVDDDE